MGIVVERIQLAPETLRSFDDYVAAAEAAMADSVTQPVEFLWSNAKPERVQQVRKGEIIAEYWGAERLKGPLAVPHGLIHDWVGSVFVPDRTVRQVAGLLQDYPNHKNIYKPEVIESAVVTRTGDRFQIYLRLLKKKIITVVLDTYHDVLYSWPAPHRALCTSHTTRILEVEHAGTAREVKSPPDLGYGFLWRLYSYWRLEEKDGGVVLECRAISLSRDVPAGLAWVINPMVRKLPKESLIRTLDATRKGLAAIRRSEPEQAQPLPT